MNTQTSPTWMPALALILVLAPAGLAQNARTHAATATGATTRTVASGPRSNQPPASLRLSPWTKEIVKLAQAGIEESVVQEFIRGSGTFNLGAEQIIYLREQGVSNDAITAMLQHDLNRAAGTEPVVTLTMPPTDFPFPLSPVPSRDTPKLTGTSSPTAEVLAPEASRAVAAQPSDAPVPGLKLTAANFAPSRTEDRLAAAPERETPSAVPQPQPAAATKRRLYPVMEPYPVELTAPIIFIQAAGPTPNTLIIELVPSSRR